MRPGALLEVHVGGGGFERVYAAERPSPSMLAKAPSYSRQARPAPPPTWIRYEVQHSDVASKVISVLLMAIIIFAWASCTFPSSLRACIKRHRLERAFGSHKSVVVPSGGGVKRLSPSDEREYETGGGLSLDLSPNWMLHAIFNAACEDDTSYDDTNDDSSTYSPASKSSASKSSPSKSASSRNDASLLPSQGRRTASESLSFLPTLSTAEHLGCQGEEEVGRREVGNSHSHGGEVHADDSDAAPSLSSAQPLREPSNSSGGHPRAGAASGVSVSTGGDASNSVSGTKPASPGQTAKSISGLFAAAEELFVKQAMPTVF